MIHPTDEAGFEMLAGTEESVTSSGFYTERAFVLSRGFVHAVLFKRPGGITDIANWLYVSKQGPRYLETIIREALALLPGLLGEETMDDPTLERWRPAHSMTRLSRGAAILLERKIQSLGEIALSCMD